MGKINVVLEDGTVHAVDEEDYVKSRGQRAGGTAESPMVGFEREARAQRAKEHEGVVGAASAFALTTIDTASAGIIGKITNALSPQLGQQSRELQEDHALATGAGTIAGAILPGMGTAGAGVKTGVAAATGSKVAGIAAEGAFIGAGSHVAHTNITGDPLTVEGMAEAVSIGGAVGLGFGLVSKGLSGIGKGQAANGLAKGEMSFKPAGRNPDTLGSKAARARAKVDSAVAEEAAAAEGEQAAAASAAEREAARAAKTAATEAKRAAKDELKYAAQMVDDLPSYNAAKDAHNSYRSSIQQANKAIKAEQDAYDAFASPRGANKAIKDFEKVQARLRVELAASSKVVLPEGQQELLKATLKEMGEAKAAALKFAREGNYEGAADAMEALQPKVKEFLPDAIIEHPLRPLDKVREVPAELPRKLTDLGKKHPGSVSRLAGGIDDRTKAELDKVALELGFEPAETAGETLSAVHKNIHDTFIVPGRRLANEAEHVAPMRIDEALEAEEAGGGRLYTPKETTSGEWDAAAAEVDAARVGTRQGMEGSETAYQESAWATGSKKAAPEGKLGGVIDFTKRAAKYSASRMADIGGGWGVVTRMLAGEATSMAMDGVEAAVGGFAMASKSGLRAKVGAAFSQFGRASSEVAAQLGPVTASLAASFPFGEPDPEPNERKLAVNRVNDLYAAGMSAPDALYSVVKNVMGTSGDVAFKLYSHWMKGLQYLRDAAPKDPGIDITMSGSNWVMSRTEADDFSHRWEGIMTPAPYLARVLAGDGSAAGMEALAVGWPALLEEARNEAMRRDWSELDLKGHRGLSMLFGRPMSGLQDPDMLWLLQGSASQAAGQQQGAPAGQATGGKPGRPAAYDSAAAGSSVAKLTQG